MEGPRKPYVRFDGRGFAGGAGSSLPKEFDRDSDMAKSLREHYRQKVQDPSFLPRVSLRNVTD